MDQSQFTCTVAKSTKAEDRFFLSTSPFLGIRYSSHRVSVFSILGSNKSMQFSLPGKPRRRHKIRAKLEQVSRIVATPRIEEESALALFLHTSCAVLTESGEIIVSNTTPSRPFQAIAPKIRAIRATAHAMSEYLPPQPNVVHIRGRSAMLHAYYIGPHTLVALTEVSPGARNLDAVVERVDRCLGLGGDGVTILEQLSELLKEF